MGQIRRPKHRLEPSLEREILEAVAGIDFGSVEVVIHQGRVVSIEMREKRRIDVSAKAAEAPED